MKLPVPAPQLFDTSDLEGMDFARILANKQSPEVKGVYDHWDHVRHLPPPAGLAPKEWWYAIKMARMGLAMSLPLKDKNGTNFKVSLTSSMQRRLHFLDREAAGAILGADVVEDDATRKRFLIRSLIEEAMTSSQLEGASTTRQIAKEMLSTGRQPRDRSEQMIYNNYAMMQSLRSLIDRPLSVQTIKDIHRRLMVDASDEPDQAGRFRTAEDNVVIEDRADPAIVLHVPPPASEMDARMQALCDFANSGDEGDFLSPIVKAIAIHFQIGYDHPFCDGNGRTARTLFYLSMLKSGYWMTEYLSISSVLKKAPAQYVNAYLYTESDGADMSYFIWHQLCVIEEAVNSLRAYLARKAKERIQAERLLRPGSPLGAKLNHRQRALILHAIRHPDSLYEISGHQAAHRVTYPTARSDLLGLAELKLLDQHRSGKSFVFSPVSDLSNRLGK